MHQTGVGKTVATDLIRQRMEIDQEDLHNIDVEFVYLNCKKLTSNYAVAANLVNCFRSDDDQITTTGYPPDMVYNMLYKEFINLNATHVLVVLDRVDAIGSREERLVDYFNHGEQRLRQFTSVRPVSVEAVDQIELSRLNEQYKILLDLTRMVIFSCD